MLNATTAKNPGFGEVSVLKAAPGALSPKLRDGYICHVNDICNRTNATATLTVVLTVILTDYSIPAEAMP